MRSNKNQNWEENTENELKYLDKYNQNDNGFVLGSKYDNAKIKTSEFRNRRIVSNSGTETNSPIKKWNKHAKEENNARVLLFSHVFNS